MNDSTTSRFRSNFNTDPSIWKVTKHHGTTLRIVAGPSDEEIRQWIDANDKSHD